MPRNATGNFNIADPAFSPQSSIIASQMNDNMDDIASGLTTTLATTGVTSMTGQIIFSAGAVALPSMIFSNDVSTGYWMSGTNVWSFSASGTKIYTLSAAGITMTPGAGGDFIDKNANKCYGLPPGVIAPFAGSVAPSGWLLCFGQAISRTTYAALLANISTNFGVGDGTTTFNLPDLRGRVPAALDGLGGTPANRLTNASTGGISGSTIGNAGGLQTFTATIATLPSCTFSNTLGLSFTNNTPASTSNSSDSNRTGGSQVAQFINPQITLSVAVTGTVGCGGSDTPSNIVQPTLIMNQIIFTGVFT